MTTTIPEEFEWVKDNVPVWYRPSLRSDRRFAGRVDGVPWCAGGTGETWMVHLDEMEPGYRDGRNSVKAAYVGALEPREEHQTGRLPPLSFKRGKYTFWLHTMGNNGFPYATQEETTDDDLIEALRQISDEQRLTRILVAAVSPRLDDETIGPNIAIMMLVRAFDHILDTGERPDGFESQAIERFIERLLDLRGHPDPGFGVDPQDSAELCALRQLIDDHLVWPAPAAEEQGRYDLAIEHSGKLAKRYEFIQKAYYNAERELP